MSTEMGLDPSDPLNLLLQNGDSASEDALQQEGSQDWSKFSTLWTDSTEQAKPYSDMMDFTDFASMPMGMDMDFNPSMSIEPSALHYDPLKFNFSYDDQFSNLSSELLASQFPFVFQSGTAGSDFGSSSDSSQSFTKERRLSITSSTSSSGASLSPSAESVSSPAPGYTTDIQPKEEPALDPAAELAQRVRQSAGVMLAVPMNAQLQGMGIHIPANPSKLPIPRLPQHTSVSASPSSNASTSSAASTPPPSTPPASASNVNPFKTGSSTFAPLEPVNAPVPTTAGLPRPKTSHTTIERRYRTNLNARIQSLRMAVPALRVLEDREGGNGKKIKKNVKGSVLVKGSGSASIEAEDGSVVDIIDERGFVDGVKVARKCSKANVLGKAVEYIRVLKKREQRLKAEQAGLKALISGLVGGPALVREWEKEWRINFGGEEKDEVEGDDEDADDDDSEDEDGDDGDEDGGRKRKRPKASTASAIKKVVPEKKKPVSPVPPSNESSSAGMPEKRKRGRPRKVLPPPVTLLPVASSPSEGSVQDEPAGSTPFTSMSPQWTQQPIQPQQYLLAVFALFSFFNSPLTTSSFQPHHHRTGAVLSTAQPPLAYAPEIVSQFAAPEASVAAEWAWKEYMQMLHLVVSILVLAGFIGSWLGIDFALGLGKIFGRSQSSYIHRQQSTLAGIKKRNVTWIELARECVLEGNTSLSFYERIQMYRSMSTKRSVSVSDLTNLAIVFHGTTGLFAGLAAMKARAVWNTAKTKSEDARPNRPVKISEQLVLETLTVDNAANRLTEASLNDRFNDERAYTPIEVLGSLVVKERVKKHLATLFIRFVSDETEASTPTQSDEQEWRRTIEAARELGGHVEQLGKVLERAWKADPAAIEDSDLELDSDADEEAGLDSDIRALLTAVVLYRRLFAEARDGSLSSSTLLSPPPTPTAKTSIKRGQMFQSLRTVLGNRVFEDEELVEVSNVEEEGEIEESICKEIGLEDARDRVVDLIFDSERRLRAASP